MSLYKRGGMVCRPQSGGQLGRVGRGALQRGSVRGEPTPSLPGAGTWRSRVPGHDGRTGHHTVARVEGQSSGSDAPVRAGNKEVAAVTEVGHAYRSDVPVREGSMVVLAEQPVVDLVSGNDDPDPSPENVAVVVVVAAAEVEVVVVVVVAAEVVIAGAAEEFAEVYVFAVVVADP